MKKIVLLITVFLFPSLASARYYGPIIVKTNFSGYSPQEWSKSEKCEVYRDKIVITKSFGQNSLLKEERKIETSGLFNLVSAARNAEVNDEDNRMCDGPATHIKAVHILPNDGTEDVLLYTTGGCGAPQKARVGAQASHLIAIIDSYCPKTHKLN